MLYIDDTTWGPEADFIESGYQIPVGSIHLFIGGLNRLEPEPDHYAPTEATSRLLVGSGRSFIGFINEPPKLAHSVETLTDDDSAELPEQDEVRVETPRQSSIRSYGLKNAGA